jgi:hypothetical protein
MSSQKKWKLDEKVVKAATDRLNAMYFSMFKEKPRFYCEKCKAWVIGEKLWKKHLKDHERLEEIDQAQNKEAKNG